MPDLIFARPIETPKEARTRCSGQQTYEISKFIKWCLEMVACPWRRPSSGRVRFSDKLAE